MQSDPSPSPSNLQVLQKQIQDLTELYTQLQTLRQIPRDLFVLPSQLGQSPEQNRARFERLKEIGERISSSPVQEALRRAQKSLDVDPTEIKANPRRETRKRRRAPSPASPQPYISKAPQEPRAFAPAGDNVEPLVGEELPSFMKEYNQEHRAKLHIWQRTADEPRADQPQLLRFTIPDVVTVYISIGYQSPTGIVLIENMTAFAPREKKAPHLQSEYTVFQTLSQQFARVLHLHPQIGLQCLLGLLGAYECLFVDQCTGCGRVLSVEGHVPPVVRVWKEPGGREGEEGRWEPRHTGCQEDQ